MESTFLTENRSWFGSLPGWPESLPVTAIVPRQARPASAPSRRVCTASGENRSPQRCTGHACSWSGSDQVTRRWPSDKPRSDAFCRSAPAVRFMARAIFLTGDLLRECNLSSRTSSFDQDRRRQIGVAS
jgi:hypothetical protein